jgi:hypothetical protein
MRGGEGKVPPRGGKAPRGPSACAADTPGLMAKRITPHEARTIAAAAFCDPRSVVKAIEGRPLAALTLARIERALGTLGRSDLLPSGSPPSGAIEARTGTA